MFALESSALSQAEKEVTVAKSKWQLFSVKTVKSCHFEQQQLSFLKFVELWQQLFSSQSQEPITWTDVDHLDTYVNFDEKYAVSY